MKKLKWLMVLILCAQFAQASGRGGTGVGNGTGDDRAQVIAKMERELQGSYKTAPELLAWCGKIGTLLKRELYRANLQLQFGRKELAFAILKDALIAAKRSLDTGSEGELDNPPYSKILVDRALSVAQALETTVKTGNETDRFVGEKILARFVESIVQISREMDPTYVPYRFTYRDCKNCGGKFDLDAFERRFLSLAAMQLDLVNRELSDTRTIDGELHVYPVGAANGFVYLTVAEIIAAGVANDVSQTLYAYKEACVVSDLVTFANDLSAFNLCGDRSIYPTERWAVESTHEIFESTSRMLKKNSNGCN